MDDDENNNNNEDNNYYSKIKEVRSTVAAIETVLRNQHVISFRSPLTNM
jgi:hypothetical protein